MAEAIQFVGQAAQEMGVPVIPIGNPGMREDADPEPSDHATASADVTD